MATKVTQVTNGEVAPMTNNLTQMTNVVHQLTNEVNQVTNQDDQLTNVVVITQTTESPSLLISPQNVQMTESQPLLITQQNAQATESQSVIFTLQNVPTTESSSLLVTQQNNQTTASLPSPQDDKKQSKVSKEERLCLICGDRANGVHYNVLSCEGCKSFFLRSAKSKAVFTCTQGGTCSMDLYTRRHCPACRMQRCKELGMSLERVWDKERLKTRKPLVRVKRKRKQPPVNSHPAKVTTPVPTSSGLPISPGMVTQALPQSVLSQPQQNVMQQQTPMHQQTPPESPQQFTPQPSPQPAPPAQPVPELTLEQQQLLEGLERGYTASKEVFKNIFPRAGPVDLKTSNSTNAEGATGIPPDVSAMMAGMAGTSMAGMTGMAGMSSSSAAAMIESQLEQMQAEGAEVIGKMTDDPEAFQSSLQRVTSFITSGSMNMMQQQQMQQKQGRPQLQVCKELLHIAMDMFAILVKQTIHFAKTIPGFMNLTCDDQAVLIKASIIDALLLRCAESYAPDMDCLINDMNGDLFNMNMMYQVGYTTMPEPAFQFMRETKACGLTTAEYALLNGVAILSPDRTELRNRELVEQMQQNLILTLYQSTKVFHRSDKTLFARLIMKLTTLRDIAVVHLSDLMDVKVREGDLSPLIVELFGLDT